MYFINANHMLVLSNKTLFKKKSEMWNAKNVLTSCFHCNCNDSFLHLLSLLSCKSGSLKKREKKRHACFEPWSSVLKGICEGGDKKKNSYTVYFSFCLQTSFSGIRMMYCKWTWLKINHVVHVHKNKGQSLPVQRGLLVCVYLMADRGYYCNLLLVEIKTQNIVRRVVHCLLMRLLWFCIRNTTLWNPPPNNSKHSFDFKTTRNVTFYVLNAGREKFLHFSFSFFTVSFGLEAAHLSY